MHAVSDFAPLPLPKTANGALRKTGIEIEFSGLDVEATCKVIQDTLGGDVTGKEPFLRDVIATAIGEIKVELDTPARQASDIAWVRKGLDAATAIVPLEIITEPLVEDGMRQLNLLVAALRHVGAEGSRSGLLLGFGVHLNPEVVSVADAHTLSTTRAFGLLEDFLRQREALDVTRRALPFVAPWPDEFVTDILDTQVTEFADVFPVAGKHIRSRNHGLDLLPLLKFADPAQFDRLFPATKSSARPTFHFRMPDCRIDEPDWDLTQPWALWHLVETVAADEALMRKLRVAWHERSTGMLRGDAWAQDVARILTQHNTGEAA